jgi:hypothetical protein
MKKQTSNVNSQQKCQTGNAAPDSRLRPAARSMITPVLKQSLLAMIVFALSAAPGWPIRRVKFSAGRW